MSHKGETTRKDAYIKGTGPRSNVGAGDLRASGRSDLKGSLPAGGGHVRCFHKNSANPWPLHDRVWPRGFSVLISPGDLSSVGRAAALHAVGHRFESDRFHATSSRALHKKPVRSWRRDFFG